MDVCPLPSGSATLVHSARWPSLQLDPAGEPSSWVELEDEEIKYSKKQRTEAQTLLCHVNVNDLYAEWNDRTSIAGNGKNSKIQTLVATTLAAETPGHLKNRKRPYGGKYSQALRMETALTFSRQMEFDADMQSMLTSCYRAEILPRASI